MEPAAPPRTSRPAPDRSPLKDWIQGSMYMLRLQRLVENLLRDGQECAVLLLCTSQAYDSPFKRTLAPGGRDLHNLEGVRLDPPKVRKCLVRVRPPKLIKTVDWIQREDEGKEAILEAIDKHFQREPVHLFVLYYSGHGCRRFNGDWVVTKGGSSDNVEQISLSDILHLWENRAATTSRGHLLIVADSCFSGAWVEALEEMNKRDRPNNVSIVASCRKSEVCQETNEGGLFTQNITNEWLWQPMNSHPTYTSDIGKHLQQIRRGKALLLGVASCPELDKTELPLSTLPFRSSEGKAPKGGIPITTCSSRSVESSLDAMKRCITSVGGIELKSWLRRSSENASHLKKEIDDFLKGDYDDYILYYSGFTAWGGGHNGDWVVTPTSTVQLEDILKLKDKKFKDNPGKHLLIIVDAPYSGAWVTKLNLQHIYELHTDVSMIASCKECQESTGGLLGGHFTKWLVGYPIVPYPQHVMSRVQALSHRFFNPGHLIGELCMPNFHPTWTNDLHHVFRPYHMQTFPCSVS